MRLDKLSHWGSFQDWNDGTIKAVYNSPNGIIETTFIQNKIERGMDVYCVPTHHYCNLGCKMCHLTKEGIQKPMTPIKMENLVESIVRTGHTNCNAEGEKRTRNHKCLISFMGVGEPLLNLKLLKEVFENEDSLKRFGNYTEVGYAISTMMPNDSLRDLTDKLGETKFPAKVHFSMHSGFSDERFDLLPKTQVTNQEALEMLCSYREAVNNVPDVVNNLKRFHKGKVEPVEIHYTLINGVNDSNRHLNELMSLTKEFMIPIKFLRFNPIGELEGSLETEKWIESLNAEFPNLNVREYVPPGHQVGSSCGEFTKHYYHSELEGEDEKPEFEAWKSNHQIEDGKDE